MEQCYGCKSLAERIRQTEAALDAAQAKVKMWEAQALNCQDVLAERCQQLEVAQTKVKALEDWRIKVTAALLRPDGAFYEDVPKHVKEMAEQLAQEQARREAVEQELNEGKGYLVRLWGLIAPQCNVLPTLVGLATQFDNYIAGTNQDLKASQEALRLVRDALYLAGIICDAVPTRAQDSDDPTMKHLGQCVNQGQYQIIQRAIETVMATLDAAPVSDEGKP